ncbi:MAG: hypothetical protein ABI443_01470 [Chthoniobacterales bacterium]
MNRKTLLAAFLALLCVAANKKSTLTIRFHAEGSPGDGEKFVQGIVFKTPPHTGVIGIMPVATEREIVAFFPFKAKDGTMGAYFKLDSHGAALLEAFTIENRGRTVVALVNGRQVIDMISDKPISDGVITIPSGLTDAEIAAMRAEFRIIGQKEDSKKTKAKNINNFLRGDIDTTEDHDTGPTKPTPTPIPAFTTPTPSPSPKR